MVGVIGGFLNLLRLISDWFLNLVFNFVLLIGIIIFTYYVYSAAVTRFHYGLSVN